MHEIKTRSGGGTFAEINRTAFKSIPFLFSSDELLLKFEQLMEPSLIKLESNAIDNALLERTRVRLLSGLIDGEIELPAGLIAS
jgi:hypothetical protein